MKKFFSFALALFLSLTAYTVWAEEASQTASSPSDTSQSSNTAPATPAPAEPASTTPVPSTTVPSVSALPTTPAATASTPEPVKAETASAADNLEFVSGQVASVDQANKMITVKFSGETEDKTNEKILSVKLDESTDITDGEKDRDLKSLTAGTEIDVEYDPATNKATYIFVY